MIRYFGFRDRVDVSSAVKNPVLLTPRAREPLEISVPLLRQLQPHNSLWLFNTDFWRYHAAKSGHFHAISAIAKSSAAKCT